ncbi:MAG: hypothetical protein AAFY26_11200 [Cyanobacteria bacterium J06638_22]
MVAIYERKDLIDEVRVANQPIWIYRDSEMTGNIMQLAPEAQVRLTGIVGDGLAQVKTPRVGWVNAGNLKMPFQGGYTKGTAYRLRNTPELRNGLLAYYEPGASMNDGPAATSTVFLTVPGDSYVENGRIFVRVFFTGKFGAERAGYVSQGPVGSTIGETSSNFVAV